MRSPNPMRRSIQHNNTTPLSRFLFFWNFTIGADSIRYVLPNISKIVKWFSLKLFVLTGWTSDFVLKQTKGGFPSKFGIFGPFEIGVVGDKHPHDSDHAECILLCNDVQRTLMNFVTARRH